MIRFLNELVTLREDGENRNIFRIFTSKKRRVQDALR